MLQDVAIHFKALFAGDLSFSSDGGSSWASDIDIKEGTAGGRSSGWLYPPQFYGWSDKISARKVRNELAISGCHHN